MTAISRPAVAPRPRLLEAARGIVRGRTAGGRLTDRSLRIAWGVDARDFPIVSTLISPDWSVSAQAVKRNQVGAF